MRIAYADPPYLGLAAKFYGELHPDAAAYDDPETHRQLIRRLDDEFDGWAMSLHTPSLRTILAMCPEDVRIGAWVKPFAYFKIGVSPAFAWEPVIFRPLDRSHGRRDTTIRDWTAANIELKAGFKGAKPPAFCWWMFDLLRAEPDDEFTDLFPGSGAVTRAWEGWRSQLRIDRTPPDAPDLGLSA